MGIAQDMDQDIIAQDITDHQVQDTELPVQNITDLPVQGIIVPDITDCQVQDTELQVQNITDHQVQDMKDPQAQDTGVLEKLLKMKVVQLQGCQKEEDQRTLLFLATAQVQREDKVLLQEED